MSVRGARRASRAMRRLALVIAIGFAAAVVAGPQGSGVAASGRGATAAHRSHKHKKKTCQSRQKRRSKKPTCTILPTFRA